MARSRFEITKNSALLRRLWAWARCRNQSKPVLLSAAGASRSEAPAESKHPYPDECCGTSFDLIRSHPATNPVAHVGMLRLRMVVSYRSRPCCAQHDNGGVPEMGIVCDRGAPPHCPKQ